MKVLLLLCALVAAALAYGNGNTFDTGVAYRRPHPGHNRVYDEFEHPRRHHRRHHRGRRASSGDSSDSRDWSSEDFIYLPQIQSNPTNYGGSSNDAPASDVYGSVSNDAPSTYYGNANTFGRK